MITQDDIDAFADGYAYWSEPPSSYPTPLEMTEHYQKTTEQTPDPDLYSRLIREEFTEWVMSLNAEDLTEELKELADLVYVVYGYANAKGWDLDEALYRVHSNNLGRMYQPDGSIKRRDDGKIIKNKDYPTVDLSDLV